MYHKMLNEEMDKVQRGEEPMCVFRDPAENEPMIDIRRERRNLQTFESRYDTHFDRLAPAK